MLNDIISRLSLGLFHSQYADEQALNRVSVTNYFLFIPIYKQLLNKKG